MSQERSYAQPLPLDVESYGTQARYHVAPRPFLNEDKFQKGGFFFNFPPFKVELFTRSPTLA